MSDELLQMRQMRAETRTWKMKLEARSGGGKLSGRPAAGRDDEKTPTQQQVIHSFVRWTSSATAYRDEAHSQLDWLLFFMSAFRDTLSFYEGFRKLRSFFLLCFSPMIFLIDISLSFNNNSSNSGRGGSSSSSSSSSRRRSKENTSSKHRCTWVHFPRSNPIQSMITTGI